MIKVGIIGATGYTGVELVRILNTHPEAEVVAMSSHSHAGKAFHHIYPDKTSIMEDTLEVQDPAKMFAKVDVVFMALPHGHAVSVAREGLSQGKPIIDLGADFRFKDKAVYEKWYKVEHTGEDILPLSHYCLPEINRDEVPGTRIVGNPGCYPTSVILGLSPLLRRGWIDPQRIIIDAKSGVSGAGRKMAQGSHFCEVNDSIKAYGVGTHRHTPEIEEQLGKVAGEKVLVNFTPHLVPMSRGILSTMVADLVEDVTQEQLQEAYRESYDAEPFVQLLQEGTFPSTKWVYGSNQCHIQVQKDERTGRVIVVSAIDNLVKGAAGQAVQNMNLLFGLEETMGLMMPPMFP